LKPSPLTKKKKARMRRSNFKVMLIVFFDIQITGRAEWEPSGQTVHQQYYIGSLGETV